MKTLLIIVTLAALYLTILFFSFQQSPAAQEERTWSAECAMKGGMILPRTNLCIKKEAIIEQDKGDV